MKLTLVAIHIEASARAVPLGPAMLASILKQAFPEAVQTRVLDGYLHESAEAFAARILDTDPDWVGLSIYVWNRARAREIAGILKRRKPSLMLFAGGAEATADPEGMRGEGLLDLVLPGEGEELIRQVLGRLLQGASIAELRENIHPAPVEDLASLPSPYLDGTLDPSAYPGMLWELSRGCPFRCDFCFESRGTKGTRRIPMERVERELLRFEACGVSQVFVLDPTFNFDKVQAKAILRLIAAEAPAIHFFFEIRSEFIDRELARLFASIRCTLQIGLQSADDAVLKRINRSLDRADFEAKVLLLHRAGATYGFDLIYGLPGDTLQGFLASLDFALGLVPNHLDLFPLSVLPGTRLRETAPVFGLRHLKEIPYTVVSSPGFSEVDMASAARIARACDLMYNEGKAVPWFAMVLDWLSLTPSELFGRFAEFLETHAEPGPMTFPAPGVMKGPIGHSRTQHAPVRPSLRPLRGPAEPSSGCSTPPPASATTGSCTFTSDITALQVAFIASCFPDPKEAAVAADIVTYFGYSGALLEAAAQEAQDSAPTRLAYFHHDPRALLEQLQCGITELEDLACVLPDWPCQAQLSVEGEETRLRILEPGETT